MFSTWGKVIIIERIMKSTEAVTLKQFIDTNGLLHCNIILETLLSCQMLTLGIPLGF